MKIDQPLASAIVGTDGVLRRVGALTGNDGDVLTRQADGTLALEAPAASGMADPGSNGIVARTTLNTTTARTITAGSGISVSDGDGVSGNPTVSLASAIAPTTIELGHASDTTLSRAAAGVIAVEGVRIQPVSSASDPTVNDDSGDGYGVGQTWVNTTTDAAFILVDATVGAAIWRPLLRPVGVKAYLSGGVWYAVAITIDASGASVACSAPVAMTAEGTSYSEGLSGTTLTLTGPLTGNTGAIQSNSRRWYVALSDLGITLSTTNTRWANLFGLCSSITDNGEVRAGTVDLGCYLGVGSTTAICGASVYRPSSGTAYGVDHFQTTATAFTNAGANANARGFTSKHSWPSSSGLLATSILNSTGGELTTLTSSGVTLSASAPTHFVVYLRSGAGASGAVFSNPVFTAFFGPQVTAL